MAKRAEKRGPWHFQDKEIELQNPFVPKAKRPVKDELCTSQLPHPFLEQDIPMVDPFTAGSGSEGEAMDDPDVESVSSNHSSTSQTSSQPFSADAGDDLHDPFASFMAGGSERLCSNVGDVNDECLYPGSEISVLKVLAILFFWFCSYPGITKEAFSRLLFLLRTFILPAENRLPSSYAKARGMMNPFIVPVDEYDCCINDCILFRNSPRGKFSELDKCPHCGEPRFNPDTNLPQKRFKYIPLRPRIERLFRNKYTSELIQQHGKRSVKQAQVFYSLHESNTWREWYSADGIFRGDPRGLSLSLCTDGVNPFAKEKVSYSMWPIMLTILNLPHSLRKLAGSLLLAGIIPGKSEPHNTDPYLEVLVDELQQMSGTQMYDGFRDELFQFQGTVNMHVLDYPGQGKVFHCQGAGAYSGCCYCCNQGDYAHNLDKMVYLGHRCFLAPTDPLIRDRRNFPKTANKLKQPCIKDMPYLDNANGRYAAAATKTQQKRIAQETGCKGTYVLRSLPGHERFLNTPVEPMHLVKDIAEHVVRLLSGKEDSIKVRIDEKLRNRFPTAWVEDNTRKRDLPPAPFRLTKEEIILANKRALRIVVPFGFDWCARPIFGAQFVPMKSHEWKQLMCKGILKFCLQGMLAQRQRTTLFLLCDVFARLYSEECNSDALDELEVKVHRALSLFERDFPASIQVIVFHLLHHLPRYLRRFGPVYNYWMYHFERYNSWITRRIHNRRYPESTVIETYRLSEWVNFLELSGQLPEGAVQSSDMVAEQTTAVGELDLEAANTLTLDVPDLDALNSYYKLTIPQYRQLCDQYDQERKKASRRHCLKRFPAMSDWVPQDGHPLSSMESDLCHGPSCAVKVLDYWTRSDEKSRQIRLRSDQFDTQRNHRSFVYLKNESELRVGQISLLFEHSFVGRVTQLACVRLFPKPSTDEKSGFLFLSLRSNSTLVVSPTSLCNQLVLATDADKPETLWILDY